MSTSGQVAVQQLSALKNEHQMLVEKLTELELEMEEHRVVLSALEPLDPERTCHRLIGGVLVGRSVAQVVPALQRNLDGISQTIQNLQQTIKTKEETIIRLQKEFSVVESS